MAIAKAPAQSPEDAVSILAKLVDRAKFEIKMSTAFTRSSYAGPVLRPAIERALERLPDSGRGLGSPFKVLIDYGVPESSLDPYASWWLSHPKVEVRMSPRPVLHLTIVDRSSFRIEQPHKPDELLRSNVHVFDAIPSLADPVNRMFDDFFAEGAVPEGYGAAVSGGVDLTKLTRQPTFSTGSATYVLDRISLEPPGTRCVFVKRDPKGRLERTVSVDSGLVRVLPSGEVQLRLPKSRILELFG